MFVFDSYSTDSAQQLAHDHHGRRANDDGKPRGSRQWLGTEHASAKGDDEPLPNKDGSHDEQHAAATLQVAEGRMVREQCAGVEQVPPLQHDEGGEEAGKLAGGYPRSAVLYMI